ncbi:PadR family transcriptional regulator [Streptomyces sp. NPDC048566]|uniref:PadR family transcriptional regulator n=1 Tax=Streptomyces sp. NPDC048566 TaxID=3365569 RepID=UPI0037193BEC
MPLRMTLQTVMVLRALMSNPTHEFYGRELADATGLMPGTTHPILVRLEHEGWVVSRKEDIDPRQEKRPARRYYRLTAGGAMAASEAIRKSRRPSDAVLGGLTEEGTTG